MNIRDFDLNSISFPLLRPILYKLGDVINSCFIFLYIALLLSDKFFDLFIDF